jgi:hypothetical protein
MIKILDKPSSILKTSILDRDYEQASRVEINDVLSNDSKSKLTNKQSSSREHHRESSKSIKRMEELLTFDSPSKVKPSERLK